MTVPVRRAALPSVNHSVTRQTPAALYELSCFAARCAAIPNAVSDAGPAAWVVKTASKNQPEAMTNLGGVL